MSDDEQAIRTLIDTWMAATATGDLSSVLTLMADDVIFLVAGRPPFGKAAFAENARTMQNVQIDGRAEVQEIEVSGNMAYCWNQLTVRVVPLSDGEPTIWFSSRGC